MSLPDSDYYLRWSIREAMTKRKAPPSLIIVNPDKNVVHRTKELIGVRNAKWYRQLDKFIENKPEKREP